MFDVQALNVSVFVAIPTPDQFVDSVRSKTDPIFTQYTAYALGAVLIITLLRGLINA